MSSGGGGGGGRWESSELGGYTNSNVTGGAGQGGTTGSRNATANTGSGGGGSGSNTPSQSATFAGGNGGSGIIILRYPNGFDATVSSGVTTSSLNADVGSDHVTVITGTSSGSETITFS